MEEGTGVGSILTDMIKQMGKKVIDINQDA
jgi:hypothetical protein